MKLLCTIIVILSSAMTILGQGKWDYIWPAGYDNIPNMEIPRFGGHDLNFNNTKITTPKYYRPINYDGFTNAAICDEHGNLMYQSNGCYILGPDNKIVPGSDSLTFGTDLWYNALCELKDRGGAYRIDNSAFVLPFELTNSYLLVNQVADYTYFPKVKEVGIFSKELRATKIDGIKNSIEFKNKVVLPDSVHSSFLTAVKHQDGKKWWIMQNEFGTNKFFALLFHNEDSVTILSQRINTTDSIFLGVGTISSVFSVAGNKLAIYDSGGGYSGEGGLKILDFDRATGMLSNYQFLYINDSLRNKQLPFLVGQIAFSPSGRFIYLSQLDYVMQFDLEAPDPSLSGVIVGYDDYFRDSISGNYVDLWSMKLGPDCRIWMSSTSSSTYYHVINFPDRKGTDCGFQLRAVKPPSNRYGPFPHQPFYRTGTPYPVCDSTILLPGTVNTAWLEETREWMPLVHSPNPVSTQLKVYTELPPGGAGVLSLYDMYGRVMYTAPLVVGANELMVDTYRWSSGLYYSTVVQDGRLLISGKFMKVE